MVWGLNPSFPNVLGPKKTSLLAARTSFFGAWNPLTCHVMLDISSASYCRSLLPKRRSGKGMVRMRNVGVNWLDGSHTSGFSVSLGWVYPTKKSWIMRASRKIARWGFVNWSDQTKKPWETTAVFTGCLLLCITLSIRYCIPSDNTARCCNVAPPSYKMVYNGLY